LQQALKPSGREALQQTLQILRQALLRAQRGLSMM
jgi:hypothetical protein